MSQSILYEGKAKQILTYSDDRYFLIHFKDSATAFNNKKKAEILGKGALNQKISSTIFKYLENHGIKTHFVSSLSDTDMLVKKVKIVPLEVVVRNVAAGSLCKRLNIPEKQELLPPLLEFYYKSDVLEDPLINDDHVRLLNLCTADELNQIKALALKINTLMIEFFKKIQIILVDFKLEFGRDQNGEIILADEISPDGCRLWDENTLNVMDKDRFRKDMGNFIEAYQEVYARLEK